jgi:hypothetical protein
MISSHIDLQFAFGRPCSLNHSLVDKELLPATAKLHLWFAAAAKVWQAGSIGNQSLIYNDASISLS